MNQQTNMSEMRRMTAYFSQLSGESNWQVAEPIFDALFHPDVVIVGEKQTWDYQGWKDWYKNSIQDGVTVDMEKIEKVPEGILYTITVHQADGSLKHTAKGIFKEGKLIRTEPVDPKLYDKMAKRRRNFVPIL